jgi:thymidylate synthase
MQYVALQMMIAKHLGFELGTFSWHVMNLHIYDRHLEQAHQLLHRFEHYDSFDVNNSQLSFKLQVPDRTDFYNISASDFLLENYHPIQPQLKFELAI